MRYDVKKFLFIGVTEDKERFFQRAQEAGIVHFIEGSEKATREVPTPIGNITAAIKVLRSLPTMEQESLDDFALADDLVHKILTYKQALEKLAEEERILRLEMARVAVFGDFSNEDIAFIEKEGDCKVQFFFSKHGILDKEPLQDAIYVGTEHGLDYFVAISEKPKQFEKLVEMRIERPFGELKHRLNTVQAELHATEQSLKTYAKYNEFLHHALIAKLNNHDLKAAQSHVQPRVDDQLFVTEGWVPVNKLDELQPLVHELNIHTEETAIEPTDSVPTYLENHGASRIGEDLVHIYDTPSAGDKDPSLWVLVFFSFFFAFIVGDGGYGLVFLLVALYVRFKSTHLKSAKKRVLKLFTILCGACIAWGVLTNSFFGINFSHDSPMRKISLLNWLVEKKAAYHIERHDSVYDYWVNKYPQIKDVQDSHTFVSQAVQVTPQGTSYDLISKFSDNIMLETALLIGTIHILLSMFRYLNRNWVNMGWILFIIGCYLYIPYYLQATSMIDFLFDIDRDRLARDGLYLIVAGISIATVISLFKNRLLGLLEPMTAIQIFSDVMSYLRLYALGLAGAIVTATINETAGSIGLVLGGMLLIVGYAINMLLAIMGGVIHGLRLNFLEWYHYSFEGGGKMFKPLRKIPIE